jgi:hypothetical protein
MSPPLITTTTAGQPSSKPPHWGKENSSRRVQKHDSILQLCMLQTMIRFPCYVCLNTSAMPMEEKGYLWREIIHEGKNFQQTT